MRILILLFLLGIGLLLDYRVYTHLSQLEYTGWMYVLICTVGYLGLFYLLTAGSRSFFNRSVTTNVISGVVIAIFIAKVLCVPIALLTHVGVAIAEVAGSEGDMVKRIGLSLYVIPAVVMLAMIYGALLGKYRFAVEEVAVQSARLPVEFDGFRVAHISDIHSGTWDSVEQVSKGIKMIQEQKPDIILFTGDLVNYHKDEINPYIDAFAQLKAPYGKYAVLGNHDYIGRPRSQPERGAYWADFISKYDKMGFELLLNESRQIKHDGAAIALLGVENWGKSQYFPKKGDLNIALSNVPNDQWALLMSHDPSHWSQKIIKHDRIIDLTLSGHTHGMQFGINTPWFKWSPVKYQYPHWMGLYEEKRRQLYVNRGFGMLAYPGRVGMTPEITIITLRKQ